MRFLVALFIAVLLGGCNADKLVKPDTPSDSASPKSSSPQSTAPVETPTALNIGDVEAEVFINATIAENSRAANVQVQELAARNEKINLLTVDITPPYPEQLWVTFVVRSQKSFSERPVVMRGKILRDDYLVDEYKTILGRTAASAYRSNPPLNTYSYDVFEAMGPPPESVLVRAEAEVLLLPPGTDEATVDLDAATVPPNDRAVISSNPVRINFLAAAAPATTSPNPDAPKEPPAPQPAAPEPAP